ncbi:hypothetical protein [Candidatus Protochlamydia sp. W-9]|uniref:hypothetical protein n=1 Tax=Candidatus Protochlamydia sp. W-9 TaxID=1785087 RepID=UPI00096A6546|nr:hypothetical protein [Candidatus Protochlamydia sp. W-9]
MNKKILLGSLAGGFVGLTTALLLAPKSGNQLIKDAYKPLFPLLRQLFSYAKKNDEGENSQIPLANPRKSIRKAKIKTAAKAVPKPKKSVSSTTKKLPAAKKSAAKSTSHESSTKVNE